MRQLYWIPIALVLGIGFLVVLNSNIRDQLHRYFVPPKRVILSSVQGDVLNNGTVAKVLKVIANGEIFVEVYGESKDGATPLIDQIRLGAQKNGFFTFNGKVTTLAIDDVDGDQKIEILAPTFDENLLAHLNIYRFDEATGSFRRVNP